MTLRSRPALRAPAADVEQREPASPRVYSSLRAGWCWLKRASDALNDHWLGDLIGAVSLFATGWMLLFLGMIFE